MAEFISSFTLLEVCWEEVAGRLSELTDGGFEVDISLSLPLIQASTGSHILLASS